MIKLKQSPDFKGEIRTDFHGNGLPLKNPSTAYLIIFIRIKNSD